ncbi:MAG: nucleotidyltransferase family protein [Desulfocucumaceae bacterium]
MIAAVVLAAGTSSRLGTPKQLLPYHGRPVLAMAVQNLLDSPVDCVLVVLGHRWGEVAAALKGLPVEVVVNSRYATGQASSIKAGLAALGGGVEAALFALGDQPLVQPGTIKMLVEGYRAGGGIVAPFYRGRRGNPVLFGRRFFNEMASLEGDTGAREIMGKHPECFSRIDVPDPGVLLDIDTWEDYRRLVDTGE